jgi:hypothetical protein
MVELGYDPLAPPAMAPPAMTAGDQAKPVREAPPSIRRGQRDRGNAMDVISSASDRDALRARIRDQSRAVADHIAADAQARSFIDNWATPEPHSR